MGRIVNDLDTIQFSIKKASQLVKEIGRQVCCFWSFSARQDAFLLSLAFSSLFSSLKQVMTDKCIMAFLLLIVLGVIAIIVVKVLDYFSFLFLFIFYLGMWGERKLEVFLFFFGVCGCVNKVEEIVFESKQHVKQLMNCLAVSCVYGLLLKWKLVHGISLNNHIGSSHLIWN